MIEKYIYHSNSYLTVSYISELLLSIFLKVMQFNMFEESYKFPIFYHCRICIFIYIMQFGNEGKNIFKKDQFCITMILTLVQGKG